MTDIEALISELKEASAHEISNYKSNLYRQCRIALRQLSEERDGLREALETFVEPYSGLTDSQLGELLEMGENNSLYSKLIKARAKLKGQDDEG